MVCEVSSDAWSAGSESVNEGLCSSWKPSVELLRAAINDAATSDLIKHAADWFEVLQILRRFEKARA